MKTAFANPHHKEKMANSESLGMANPECRWPFHDIIEDEQRPNHYIGDRHAYGDGKIINNLKINKTKTQWLT